jgi:hypothetical protein
MAGVRGGWVVLAASVGVIGVGRPLDAQDQAALAKAAQNPVADMISLPFQNNTAFGWGDFDRTQNVLNIQPVIPFKLGGVNLITRTIVPIISQPDIGSDTGGTFGLGDINASFYFSPAKAGKLIWGAGPVVMLNTATNDVLGTGKWGIGPSVVLLTMPGHWVVGVLANNIWSVAGDTSRADVNQMLVQYFVNYNLPNGWYLSSAPINTVNWKATSNKATIPLGGGVGKIIRLGRLPVNGSIQAYYNVAKPDAGPDWTARFQVQLLFPQ